MPFRPRILILPVAAIIIASLCAWRIANPHANLHGALNPDQLPEMRQAAPPFQLYDQESTVVNFSAYLNRHRIVLVFFDGQAGPDNSPVLNQLREFYPALEREGVMVFGVSTALPQEIRNNSRQSWPFAILSDADATAQNSVHRVWGTFVQPSTLDKPAGTTPAVFLIDRSGLVAWDGKFPKPEADSALVLNKLLSGDR